MFCFMQQDYMHVKYRYALKYYVCVIIIKLFKSICRLHGMYGDISLPIVDGRSSRMDELNNPTVAKPTEKDVDNDE